MKFALVNNKRSEATKGAKGICPSCGSELIAKCGKSKINHWAHKTVRNCDPWWENETEWHRSWKNNFPFEWQEFPFHDERTNEKHIADIHTIHNLVIEFQHSHIDPQERIIRETFYKNIIWVVDGTRLKRDYPRFFKRKSDFLRTKTPGLFLVPYPDECFPSDWVGSSVPIIFDFRGTESINDANDIRNNLYCLFPIGNNREGQVAVLTRESFINNIISGKWFTKQEQSPTVKTTVKSNIIFKKREPTHYYDPRKDRFVKRRRL